VGLWTAPEGTFTIEEFQRLPLEGRRWELLDGTVVQMEPHDLNTSTLTASITFTIDRYVREFDLGKTLGPGCGFRSWPGHETVRVTDLSFTRYDRLPAERNPHDYPRWAPDLTVEVLSPFERMATVIGRIAMFLQAGTRQVWLVNHASQIVTVFYPDAPLTNLGAADTLDGVDVLPGFSVPLAEIFAED
jgi:Uma2 family endonuclease